LLDFSDLIDYRKTLIFQEFIENSKGRDLRIIVIGGKVSGGMMRIAKNGFKSNFHQGGFVKKIKISGELEELALEIAKVTGLDITGIDILIDKDYYKICEVNSSPGFQGFELCTGADIGQLIADFCKIKCENFKKSVNLEKKIIEFIK
jgi:gamma-F420-2:alpha-L-glutamate ligase